MYDPQLGRFHTLDLLADSFSFQTPYAYAINNPIRFIDLLGMGPGDLFKTKNQAAKDWGKTYNGASIVIQREFGSTIYTVNENAYYTYTEANIGSAHGVNSSKPPEGSTIDAYIHSHGNDDVGYDDNKFSEADKDFYTKEGVDGYVATPNGSLLQFDVETSTVTVISEDLPSDPSDPDRKNETPLIPVQIEPYIPEDYIY